jgi:peroxiredoxin Q/BCP
MSSKLDPGTKAPLFTLPRDGGANVSLGDFAGRKLVLYFYPKADTPGCTKEAIDFSRLKAAFAKVDTDILGVSADSGTGAGQIQIQTQTRHRTGL